QDRMLRRRLPEGSRESSLWDGWLESLMLLRAFLTPPGVDVLEGGKLTSHNVAGSSHNPLQRFAVASGAVSKPGGDAAGQDARHSAVVECSEDAGAHSKLPQPSQEEEALMSLLQHCICVSGPCEILNDVNAEELKAVYPLHRCLVEVYHCVESIAQLIYKICQRTFVPMGFEDMNMRNGRALSDQWADSVVVRPRTTEQHITVHKRLVLGFAISILTLIIVTVIAITLSVSFERCAAESSGTLAGNGSSNKSSQSRDRSISHRESEDGQQPWRHLRLPATLRPRHYDLRLSVYMDNFTFSGEVNIEFECVNSTKFIVLHTDRLEVNKVQVYSDSKKTGVMRIHRRFYHQPNQVYVIALHREMKPLRIYKINITFEAQIENELLGFFRSSYMLYGERRYLAVTQFSPTQARKAFPCFDEPIYKATFRVSLRHESSYQSLSNMPVEASTSDEDAWVTNHFSRTPRMSTYYLAWAVCNFTYREAVTDNGVVIRLYARPDAIQSGSGDYALHITKRLLQFYQDYFQVKYSLPKLGCGRNERCCYVKAPSVCGVWEQLQPLRSLNRDILLMRKRKKIHFLN
ncbi:putative thyrotropin-releasing hormone-degrading ectoenzyme, partial [Triplophysa rosa]